MSAGQALLLVLGATGYIFVTLLAVGTGLLPGTSHVSTMTVPFAPAFVGMHLGFQSLLLSAPTMAPIWSNATDATVL